MLESAAERSADLPQRPSPRRRVGAILLGFLILAVALWALQGEVGRSGGSADDGTLRVGDRAPEFTAQDLNGNAIQLADLRGRPVLINFWATWCPPCQAEMPAIDDVARSQPDLAVLAVDVMEGPVLVQRWQEGRQLSFSPLLDPTGVVSGKYRVSVLPSSFFVAPDGTIRAISSGAMDRATIERNVERARGG